MLNAVVTYLPTVNNYIKHAYNSLLQFEKNVKLIRHKFINDLIPFLKKKTTSVRHFWPAFLISANKT